MNKLKVFISGQKWFGQEVFRLCKAIDYIDIIGVCVPKDDKYLVPLAQRFRIPVIPAGSLNYNTMPEGVDLGITAHSFDYIGKRTRYKTRLGWIGYHPSLLPRHRGRSSIEWAIRMKDPITGGTVFWLNSGIDRGDIAYRDWCFIDPKMYAMDVKEAARVLWERSLMEIGLRLIYIAISDIYEGKIIKTPQEARYSTFEPSANVNDVFKPDLLMIEEKLK